jgi:hypothetical protein
LHNSQFFHPHSQRQHPLFKAIFVEARGPFHLGAEKTSLRFPPPADEGILHKTMPFHVKFLVQKATREIEIAILRV